MIYISGIVVSRDTIVAVKASGLALLKSVAAAKKKDVKDEL